ncbi:MAG: oxidoreductase of aldo/keto reductase family, subgroup 1 [Myxococcaceae bacterium]|nr:oxidoreductase of aldo/keto reductase family, subgroup 1 [Myxococcaceae bacterium]
MPQLTLQSALVPLNNGRLIPQVGLGVWQAARGQVTRDAVHAALRLGYRHIDTARVYGNEMDVGAAVRDSGVPREQVFVTTKLWNDDQGYDATLRAFEASLTRLGLEYIDLYLLHWPVEGKRGASWKALESLHNDKRLRSIGVSNFMRPHLEELLATSEIMPAINQIELTPFLQRRETVKYCQQQGIVLEAYSPLTRGQRLTDPTLATIAAQVGRSPAQVLLRWGVQHGFVVLPKSVSAARIEENGRLFDFELDAGAMRALDGLEEGLVTGWDPATQR